MKLPATHPSFPGVFLEYCRASKSTKKKTISAITTDTRSGFKLLFIQSWRTKMFKNVQKYWQKDLNLMCKTDKNARNHIISLQCDKMSSRSWENWICKHELTIDFRGQNETKYNRISFLVLSGLIFEKRTENKSKECIQKSIWKQEIK